MFNTIFDIFVVIGLVACYPAAIIAAFVLRFLGVRTMGDLKESNRIISKLLLRYIYDLVYTYERICGKDAFEDLMSRFNN